MRAQGLSANIMSLGGIAIAIGAMVDAAIIMIENAHKHLEAEVAKPPGDRLSHWQVIHQASQEVGPPLFWSLSSSPFPSYRYSRSKRRRAGSSGRLRLQRPIPWLPRPYLP